MECTVTRYKGVFFFFRIIWRNYLRLPCLVTHSKPKDGHIKDHVKSCVFGLISLRRRANLRSLPHYTSHYTHFAAGAYKFQFWSSSLEKPHAEKFNQISKHSPIEWRGEVEMDHVFLPLNAFPLFEGLGTTISPTHVPLASGWTSQGRVLWWIPLHQASIGFHVKSTTNLRQTRRSKLCYHFKGRLNLEHIQLVLVRSL